MSKTRGDGGYVLLGNSRVHEPLTQCVAQRLQGLETQVARQKHEFRADGSLDERLAEDITHKWLPVL